MYSLIVQAQKVVKNPAYCSLRPRPYQVLIKLFSNPDQAPKACKVKPRGLESLDYLRVH